MTLVAFALIAISGNVDLADSNAPPLPRATATINAGESVSPVPRSYFGFSTEYWSVPLYGRHLALFERVLSQLRVRGDDRSCCGSGATRPTSRSGIRAGR